MNAQNGNLDSHALTVGLLLLHLKVAREFSSSRVQQYPATRLYPDREVHVNH